MTQAYSDEIRTAAKLMYLRRCPVRQIADDLKLNNVRVVYQWVKSGNWDSLLQHETVEQAASRKLIALIEKNTKDDADYKEINQLSNLLDKLAGVELKKAKIINEKKHHHQADATPSKSKKKSSIKNDISEISHEALKKIRDDLFFDYQANWYNHLNERTRFILKSRQIGATYYFAYEAFEQAVITGENQIFLSASRAQADIFKAYILKFCLEHFDITLKGSDCITLSNGAELRFISTNGRTAQGYHGHLYIDEVFWIPDFEKLNKLASGMASHKKWRKTYFSTPSVKSHGAYPLWCGEKYNTNRKRKAEFDLTHATLVKGAVGPDKIWRNSVTVEDAAAQGCDLFDIDQLRNEYSDSEFNNLFMCAFMEAGESVFNLDDLLSCAVDSAHKWVDFDITKDRPFLNNVVWLGYDPALKGDKSCVIVVAPPMVKNGKFRVLERIYLKGSFQHQANRIKELTQKYNVQFIGVDSTGMGLGVLEKVKEFYPSVTGIHYGIESKTRLVLKTIDVVDNQRLEYDAQLTDLPQGLIQVKQTTTRGDNVTYESPRNNMGHADSAWALMNALSNEPLNNNRRTATVAMG